MKRYTGSRKMNESLVFQDRREEAKYGNLVSRTSMDQMTLDALMRLERSPFVGMISMNSGGYNLLNSSDNMNARLMVKNNVVEISLDVGIFIRMPFRKIEKIFGDEHSIKFLTEDVGVEILL